jgi:broad specificity phosphatase PhoE
MEKNEFILLRHGYDDHSYIDGKNDTGLTETGIKMVKEASEKLLTDIKSNSVIIRHSVKLRAKQTAEILCERILKENIPCIFIEDHGLTELNQGTFCFDGMEHKERVDFLQSCWDDFEYCRKNGDLQHRFGQNQDRNIILTPGENHSEWSIRIAKGLLNIIDDISNSYQSINVTHRGAIFELQQLVKMVNDGLLMDEVEKYETIWVNYCKDFKLDIKDPEQSKILLKRYINKRGNYESNN